jgi:hypothetical protein
MTTVTLLIFSGRRDPTWELPAEEATSLTRWLEGLRSAPELSTLGYCGFRVRSNDPGMPREVVVRDFPELERFLLRTGERHLSPEIIGMVEAAIARR